MPTIVNDDELSNLSKYYGLPIVELADVKSDVLRKLLVKMYENTDMQNMIDVPKASTDEHLIQLLQEKTNEFESSVSESQRFINDNKELRNKILELEKMIQDGSSNELVSNSEKAKMSLKLELLSQNNQSLESELITLKSKIRSVKTNDKLRLNKLRSDLLSTNQKLQIENSKKSVILKRNDELSKSLQKKMLDLKNVNDISRIEKLTFDKEIGLKSRLIKLLERQINDLKNEIGILTKNAFDANTEYISKDDWNQLESELSVTKDQLRKSEVDRTRMNAIVHDMSNAGSSFTEPLDISSIGDIAILKRQLIKERSQKEYLRQQLESFVKELEYKLPDIESFKEKTASLEAEISKTNLVLEHSESTKLGLEKANKLLSTKLDDYQVTINELSKQRIDLAHQVQYLLIHSSIQNDDRGPISVEELSFIQRIIKNEETTTNDSQHIISERLVTFKDIVSIQEKNMELLKAVRNLASELENEELNEKLELTEYEDQTIREAKETIICLQDYTSKLEEDLENVNKDFDAYKFSSSHDTSSNFGKNDTNNIIEKDLQQLNSELETGLSDLSRKSTETIQILNSEIKELYNKNTEVSIELEKERSSTSFMTEKLNLLQTSCNISKTEIDDLNSTIKSLQSNISKNEFTLNATMENYIKCKTTLMNLTGELTVLNAERSSFKEAKESLENEISTLFTERDTLKIECTKAHPIISQIESSNQVNQTISANKIDALEEENSKLLNSLNFKAQELSNMAEDKNIQIEWYQKKFDLLTRNVEDLEKKLKANIMSSRNEQRLNPDFAHQQESDDNSPSVSVPSSDASCNEITVRHVGSSAHNRPLPDYSSTENEIRHYKQELIISKQRIETLTSENNSLFEKFENASDIAIYDVFRNLRKERDILDNKLADCQRDFNFLQKYFDSVQSQLVKANEQLVSFQGENKEQRDLPGKYDDIIMKLYEIEQLKEQNNIILNKLNDTSNSNTKLRKQLEEAMDNSKPLQAHIVQLNTSLQEQEHLVNIYKEETTVWKERAEDLLLSKEDVSKNTVSNLRDELTSLKSVLEDKSKENDELSDRFNRLKKQANERLHASKTAHTTLTDEFNRLKDDNFMLEAELNSKVNKTKELENRLTAMSDEKMSNDPNTQLNIELERKKELEEQLSQTVKQSESLQTQLKNEIEKLNNELKILRESESLIASNGDIDQLKQKLENEMAIKLETERSQFLDTTSDGSVDIEKLKTNWEQDKEIETLKRIEEAEEALKKRIRLPTEEKINKIVESKVIELEQNFERRLQEKTESETNSQEVDILKKEFDENLATAKKKAFEEGKQQTSMKTRFLENKIAKLESQLQTKDEKTEEVDKSDSNCKESSSDKESEKSTFGIISKEVGEKAVEPTKEIKQPFTFPSAISGNPFTAIGGNSPSSNSFNMKPAFSFGSNPFQSNSFTLPNKGYSSESSAKNPLAFSRLSQNKDTSTGLDANGNSAKREVEDKNEEISSEAKKVKPNEFSFLNPNTNSK